MEYPQTAKTHINWGQKWTS